MKADPDHGSGGGGPNRSRPARPGTTPGFAAVLTASWLWHLTRWAGLFASSWLVASITDDPLLNQLTGAALFAPLLGGALLAGTLSDRFDRRRLIITTQAALLVSAVAMAAAVTAGPVPVALIVAYTASLGVGGVIDLTAGRPLVYETAGPDRASRALSLEAVGQASSNLAGALLMGIVIAAAGAGAAFALLAVALAAALGLLVFRVPPGTARRPPPVRMPVRTQLRTDLLVAWNDPALISLLGVTVVMNACHFSFMPLIPVVAESYGAGPALAGLIAAAAGIGQLVSGSAVAARTTSRPGRLYAGGTALALVGLGLFAAAGSPVTAVAALLVAGTGQAGFAGMQSRLAIELAGPGRRGAALGLLGTAISALPIGMVLLGATARTVGPRTALAASSVSGLALLAVWLRCRPAVLMPAPR